MAARNGRSEIHREGAGAFAMAGLWQVWGEEEVETVPTDTILTTAPNDLIEPIQDRMPVVLPPDDEDTWVDADPDERKELCRPYPDSDLDAYEIATRGNNPGHDDS